MSFVSAPKLITQSYLGFLNDEIVIYKEWCQVIIKVNFQACPTRMGASS